MSIKWTDKQILVYSLNGTQLSTENEVTTRMSNNTDKLLKHVEQKTRKYILQDYIYLKF